MKALKYSDNWNWCVSISSGGYMSLSWKEFFFETEDEAREFRNEKEKEGCAVLMVDRDGY